MNPVLELSGRVCKAAFITMLQQAIQILLKQRIATKWQRPRRTVESDRPGQLHEGDVIAQPLWLVLAVVDDFFHQMGGGWTVQQRNEAHLDGP